MDKRLSIGHAEPAAYKAMMALENYLQDSEISKTQRELIKIRASQLNGCAYCIDMHTKDARKNGESEQRIYLLNAWRETNLYTEEERTILALTEEITLIHEHGLSEDTYQKAIQLFGEKKLAQIIMAIVTINAWNRIGVSTGMQPAS